MLFTALRCRFSAASLGEGVAGPLPWVGLGNIAVKSSGGHPSLFSAF